MLTWSLRQKSNRARSKRFWQTFLHYNIRASELLTPSYLGALSAFAHARAEFITAMLDLNPKTVVDVGAGRAWRYHPALKRVFGFELIGLDVDFDEMQLNEDLDRRIAVDVTKSMGLPPGSADLVTSRSTLEHLQNNEAFLSNLYQTLRPGGRAVLVFPNRYAPFAVMNRLIPQAFTQRLLRRLVPGSEGVLGFRAYYDRTSYGQFKKMAEDAGFVVRKATCSFYSSNYFRFFVPLYLLFLVTDHIRHALNVKSLASFYMFVLEKPSNTSAF